jgi:hypothetical protein
MRPWNFLSGVSCLLAVGALCLGGFALNDSRSTTAGIHDGLVNSCQRVGTPTQAVLGSLIRDQIRQSQAANPKYFPSIPRAEFKRLVKEQEQRLEHRLDQVEAFPPCTRRFDP